MDRWMCPRLWGFKVNITEAGDTCIPTAHHSHTSPMFPTPIHTHARSPTPACTHVPIHTHTPTAHIPAHAHSHCTHPCLCTHSHHTCPCSCTHLCTYAHIYFRTSFPSLASCSFGSASLTWGHPLLSFPLREGLSGSF